MYYTFVFPYLIYCCEILGNTRQIHLDSLIKCQNFFCEKDFIEKSAKKLQLFTKEQKNKVIRVITSLLYDAHSKPLFELLQILDLKKVIIHRTALMMYKHSVHLLTLASVIMEFIFRIS